MERTGLGHQYKKEERVIEACKNSLEQAFLELAFEGVDGNNDILKLRHDIQLLINRCIHLSYSANEAFKQNQS